ncbi:MAG: hypothetical protein QOC81_3940 [Thermoanaerobaculia bacterium]|jgi:hypothetical protein|nr:hypothetical protein [Thermoanaerobaculia bacterium]
MKRAIVALALFTTISSFAQVPVARVASDAKVIDRVAEASRNDLPRDLLKRIVNEDIDLLRGKRPDGTYQYASYDRMEANRKAETISIDPERKESVLELRDAFAYRLIVSIPSRRMLVTKNHHVYLDRVEIETLPQTSSEKKFQTVKIGAWIEPGSSQTIDLEEIGRQSIARVYAHAEKGGYANVTLTLVEARIFDDPASPYADAVESAKAILTGTDHNDKNSIRAMAQRIATRLQPASAGPIPAAIGNPPATIAAVPAVSQIEVVSGRSDPETMAELQSIEDLLTGTEAERRQGVDRLHQLVRRLRGASR